MIRAKDIYISLFVDIDGRQIELKVSAQSVRDILNQEENTGKEFVSINLLYGKDVIEVLMPKKI